MCAVDEAQHRPRVADRADGCRDGPLHAELLQLGVEAALHYCIYCEYAPATQLPVAALMFNVMF